MSDKKITKKEIDHISHLSKIRLSEDELPKYQDQISSILDYMASLNELNTSGVPETSQTTGLVNKLRKDESKPGLTQKQVLKNAPSQEKGYIKVKTVLGRET